MIERSNRVKILELILKTPDVFRFAENRDEGIVPFLNEIWDLKTMPSEDIRFPDAQGDVIQHTINNDDWDWRELFENRLKLLEDEEKFPVFLETFLAPKYQNDSNSSFNFAKLFNQILEQDKLVFVLVGYNEDLPVFEITKLENLDRQIDIPVNKIPFYVHKYSERTNKVVQLLKVDKEKPARYFVLVGDNWDDYEHETQYVLVYFDNGCKHKIGFVKIAHKGVSMTESVISDNFVSLDQDFCSLGQSLEYYETLARVFGQHLTSILYSLKDTAFFSEIAEEFENLDVYRKSLIRDDDVERLQRQAKAIIHGRDIEDLYAFDYEFTPKYAEESIKLPFHFFSHGYLPKRMIALIGKNGAGKTQALTTLPIEIAKSDSNCFNPQSPIFSKIIAVSYSTFDNFEIPKKTANFNYIYCGLRDESGKVRTDKGQLQKFHNTWKKIDELNRLEQWRNVISNMIEQELIDLFIRPKPDDAEQLYFDTEGFKQARESLSSGQSIVLYVISEIIANIRLDSLLLFDEPETHLHPNGISQLMSGIAELVKEFQSYCIIATHSPIIVQEMFARDVLVLTREENMPSVSKIGVESFGENLSVITEEIFGNRTVPKFYQATLLRLFKIHKSYEKVVTTLEEGNLPLGLSVRLFLQSLEEDKKDVKN